MPQRPSRTSPAQSRSHAAFSAEDVTAFRLRPLGHVGTVAAASVNTTGASTTHSAVGGAHSISPPPAPLPILQSAPSNKSALSHRTSPPPQQHQLPSAASSSNNWKDGTSAHNASAATAGFAASYPAAQPRTGRGKLSVSAVPFDAPPAAVPRVYAALSGPSSVPPYPAAAAAAAAVRYEDGGESEEDAAVVEEWAVHPAAHAIPPPSMSAAEARELARWTSDASTMRDAAVTATRTTANTKLVSTAPTSTDTPVLHELYHARLCLRMRQGHARALWRALSPILESAVRGTLTAEESYWQQQRSATVARGVMSSATSHTLVPADKMESLMRAVQLVLHQTTAAFAEAQISWMEASQTTNEDTNGSDTASAAAATRDMQPQHAQKAAAEEKEGEGDEGEEDGLTAAEKKSVLDAALGAERQLIRDIKTAPNSAAVPAVITLPLEAPVPPPVLRMETAVAATLLERILEQAATQTPGVAFALHLLHRFILPHVYRDYAAWRAVRPQMAGLSEQVTHLATLTLHVEGQHGVVVAARQAQHDTHYLESVVRGWTMRAWLRWVVSERHRVQQCNAFALSFARLHRRVRLQRALAKWRRRTHGQQQRQRLSNMEAAYANFLVLSKAVEGMAGVPAATAAGAPLVAVAMANAAANADVDANAATTVSTAGPLLTSATLTLLSPPSAPLQRQSSTHSRKRGAGHSRVYLSFMRQRAAEAAQEEEEEALSPSARVERFVVRNSDSDVDDAPGEAWEGEDSIGNVEDVRGNRGGDVASGRHVVKPRQLRGGRHGGATAGVAAGGATAHTGGGAPPLVYLAAPKIADGDDTALLPSAASTVVMAGTGKSTSGGVVPVPDPVAPSSLFTTMLAKLQELEQVNAYLRRELDVQSRRLRKVEADNRGLQQRNKELEDGTLRLVRERLEACNVAQMHNALIADKNRQLRQLRSRLRAHRQRPWQQTVLRLVGDVCSVSTATAERADDVRIHRDRHGTPDSSPGLQRGGGNVGGDAHGRSQHVGAAAMHNPNTHADGDAAATTTAGGVDGADSLHATTRSDNDAGASSAAAAAAAVNTHGDQPGEEERLFGRIAPIVLRSTRQLPEARVILLDWANSCLDDLQRLDDLTNGPFAARFSSLSEEVRSGALLSRLLYYLALPRYRAQQSAADASIAVPHDNGLNDDDDISQTANGNWTGMDPRRQLLEQHAVQLDPPYPVFEDCFSDIMNLAPLDRMAQLLTFATDLIASSAGDPADLSREPEQPEDFVPAVSDTLAAAGTTAVKSATKPAAAPQTPSAGQDDQRSLEAGATPPTSPFDPSPAAPPPAVPLSLHTVVDPYALARGDTSAIVTLLALLYVRFAHPFHHKSRLSAVHERRMLLLLWSSGDATAEELAGPQARVAVRGSGKVGAGNAAHSQSDPSLLSVLPMSAEGSTSNSTLLPKQEETRANITAGTVASETAAGAEGVAGHEDDRAGGARVVGGAVDAVGDVNFSMEAEMLRQLSPEDKTPWQLFRERCLPVFGTQAHPFLLRGGFWPAEAFDTPELAAMLGALAMALHRSLELHRWHITLSCLVPVRTYSGLSRGVFTGPSASPAALELGLRQDAQEWLRLDFPLLRDRVEARQAAFEAATHSSRRADSTAAPVTTMSTSRTGMTTPVLSFKPAPSTEEIRALLTTVTGVWQEDLLALFTQRASMSAQLALPVLDLGGWRLLCRDLGLIDLSTFDDNEDGEGDGFDGGAGPRTSGGGFTAGRFHQGPAIASRMAQTSVDMEIVTFIFQKAVMTVARVKDEVDPAVLAMSFNRSVRTPHEAAVTPSPGAQAAPLRFPSLIEDVDDLAPGVAEGERSTTTGEAGNAVDDGGAPLRTSHDAGRGWGFERVQDAAGRVRVPDLQMDMTYAAFVLALALLADALYPGCYTPRLITVPSISAAPLHLNNNNNNQQQQQQSARPISMSGGSGKKGEDDAIALDVADAPPPSIALQYCSLSMAFAELMRCVVLASPLVHLHPHDPRSVLRRLTGGVPTQRVLHRFAPALLQVYRTYSKDVFGDAGMLREDVLRLLRDAMLTNADLTQYLVFDLFASCAVLRQASEEAAVGARRDADGRMRGDAASAAAAAARRPGYRAVRIVDPSAASDNTSAASAQRKRAYVLTFEGFCDLVCVLCSFKQPNVFVPFEERLGLFLRRSLLRPLTHTVAGLAVLLAQAQPPVETAPKEVPKESASASDSPSATPSTRSLR